MEACQLDGCMLGVTSKDGSTPIRKPWRIASTNHMLCRHLSKFQCDHSHAHKPCESGEAEQSGYYPLKMARNILGVIRQSHLLKFQCLFIHPPLNPEQTDTDDSQNAFGITAEESESWKSLNFKEKDSLLRAAERIHANTGHRPPSELAKIMRQQGAPLNARAAMEHVKCSSCKENARPTARPVVSMEMATVPWHTVGIDIKEITTPEKQKEKYLASTKPLTSLAPSFCSAAHRQNTGMPSQRN